jgi:hypothetical protein
MSHLLCGEIKRVRKYGELQYPLSELRLELQLAGRFSLRLEVLVKRGGLICCVMSHILSDRAWSRYGEERYEGIPQGASGSAVSRS